MDYCLNKLKLEKKNLKNFIYEFIMGEKGKRQTQTGTSKPKTRGHLVHKFKHMFSVFKQYYTHFHILFFSRIFTHVFKQQNTFLSTYTKHPPNIQN